MSRIGKKAGRGSRGRHAPRSRARRSTVKGAEGRAFASRCPTTSRSSCDDGQIKVDAALRNQARARAVGHVAHAGRTIWSPASPRASSRSWRSPASATSAAVQGKNLQMSLGYSHDVVYPDPGRHRDRDAEADRDHDHRHRQAAGRPGRRRNPRISAPPEPYKGKGVKYAGEYIFRKEGKKK